MYMCALLCLHACMQLAIRVHGYWYINFIASTIKGELPRQKGISTKHNNSMQVNKQIHIVNLTLPTCSKINISEQNKLVAIQCMYTCMHDTQTQSRERRIFTKGQPSERKSQTACSNYNQLSSNKIMLLIPHACLMAITIYM